MPYGNFTESSTLVFFKSGNQSFPLRFVQRLNKTLGNTFVSMEKQLKRLDEKGEVAAYHGACKVGPAATLTDGENAGTLSVDGFRRPNLVQHSDCAAHGADRYLIFFCHLFIRWQKFCIPVFSHINFVKQERRQVITDLRAIPINPPCKGNLIFSWHFSDLWLHIFNRFTDVISLIFN